MRKLSKGEGIAVWIAVIVVFSTFLFGNNLFNFFSPKKASVESAMEQHQPVDSMDKLNTPQPTLDSTHSTGSGQEGSPQATPITTKLTPTSMQNNGLIITDERVGSGAEAVAGKTITVNYSGTFTNGTKFDSSYDRGQPFTFALGAGQVIAGWDQGFAGMKVGGKRKIVVPPQLGYGPNTYGPIPGNSTLIFEVELLDVK